MTGNERYGHYFTPTDLSGIFQIQEWTVPFWIFRADRVNPFIPTDLCGMIWIKEMNRIIFGYLGLTRILPLSVGTTATETQLFLPLNNQ